MAHELQAIWPTGKTGYFLLTSSVGTIYNGAGLEAYATANYATYKIAAAELGSASGIYVADFPTGLAAGIYGAVFKEQAGGSAVEADAAGPSGDINWNGTAVVISADLSDAAQRAIGSIVHGSKTWNVATTGSDAGGVTGNGSAPFLTIAHAQSASASGDRILVGAGNFLEAQVAQKTFGQLCGSGRAATKITSTTANAPIIKLANNSLVEGVQVVGTATAGNFQYAIGDGGLTVTDATVYNFQGGTDTDGAYFAGANSSARFFNFDFTSDWDCMALATFTGMVVECRIGTFRTVAPNSAAATSNSTLNVAPGNTLRCYDFHVVNTTTDTNASRTTSVVLAGNGSGAAVGSRIELYNGTIETNISATEVVYHLRAGVNSTILCENVSYDVNKVGLDLQVTGVPTGGTFTLTVANASGTQTATIGFNDSAAAVQTAVSALSNVGNGNLTVRGSNAQGILTLNFVGALGPVTLSANGASLTGGTSPSVGVGTVIIQNTPINQSGQIGAGALASGAISAASIAASALNGKGDWLLASGYTAPDNADIVSSLTDLVSLLNRTDPTTALTAIKSVTDGINTMLTASGGNKTFTGDALKNAPAGGGGGTNLIITPIQASITNPRFATRDLPPIAQGSAPTDQWIITDSTGAAVNLSGKTVRFVVYSVTPSAEDADDAKPPYDDTLTAKFKYETGGNGITVGGTGNNIVSVTFSASNTATSGQFYYWLMNVTDNLPLANGKLNIKPAVWNA